MCSRQWLVGAIAILAIVPSGLGAQARSAIEESRRRLDSIRIERENLQSERQRLQSQVLDVGAELQNLDAQRRTTNRIINEIDRQIGGLNSQVDQVSTEFILAQDNLAETRAILQRRLVDIYKRGPMYAWKVLLAADTFGDLISRYKYLFLTSRQDRALVADVEHLRDRVSKRRDELLVLRGDLDRSRVERDAELDRYSSLASARARRLRQLRGSRAETEAKLTRLEREAEELNQQITAMMAATRGGGGPGFLTTADIGQLDWPVEGRIVFNFGRERQPDGVVLRRNGIGIAAPVGTPVKVIADGQVIRIVRGSTYGQLVLVDHGAQYFSIYAQLDGLAVKVGDNVIKGQAIGTVGGQNSELGPHLHFEIRGERGVALDPTAWLRRGSS